MEFVFYMACSIYSVGLFVLYLCMTWPFPTKENPLKPWTKKQIKEYEEQQRAKLPEAPL
jgi:hypothetical protein